MKPNSSLGLFSLLTWLHDSAARGPKDELLSPLPGLSWANAPRSPWDRRHGQCPCRSPLKGTDGKHGLPGKRPKPNVGSSPVRLKEGLRKSVQPVDSLWKDLATYFSKVMSDYLLHSALISAEQSTSSVLQQRRPLWLNLPSPMHFGISLVQEKTSQALSAEATGRTPQTAVQSRLASGSAVPHIQSNWAQKGCQSEPLHQFKDSVMSRFRTCQTNPSPLTNPYQLM